MSTILLALALANHVATPARATRALSYEERLHCEEAIERVRYGHVIDAKLPFERAVPRAVIEGNVARALEETVVLADRWQVTITQGMLRTEVERIAAHTQFPERLRELYAALGNDPFLVQECLARPILVDRLAHERFAADVGIHGQARTAAGVRDAAPAVLWEDWWPRASAGIDVSRVAPVGDPQNVLPAPAAVDSVPNNSWSSLPPNDALTPRRLPLSVWTGSQLIVWGGYNDFGPQYMQPNGARYDPVTDSWRSMRSAGAPHPSCVGWSQIVWTGQMAVVWQGTAYGGGRRYDPVSDTWFPVTTIGAPPDAAYGRSAVWTGSKVIIWGGTDNAGHYFDSGGQYDPVTNHWTPMSNVGAPSPRYLHTAVWTGERMIVWGGDGGSPNYYLGSGALYDPGSDTWTPMTLDGAPSPRSQHTALWSGDRMIVWGGWALAGSSSYFSNTGGLYDPAADRWTPVSSVGAPSARTFHGAIWNGTFMVVWGGLAPVPGTGSWAPVNSGGRYDPSYDRWWPTAVPAGLDGRGDHSAVWTGSVVGIFGGGIEGDGPSSLSGTGNLYHVSGNHPPEPVAPTSVTECLSPAGSPVALDGTLSTDLDSTPATNDDIVSYAWYEGNPATGVALGDGASITATLTPGYHPITLQVLDHAQESAVIGTSAFVVDHRSPFGAITAPAEGACFGSASLPVVIQDDVQDLCDSAPRRTYAPSGPSITAHGDHTVTETVEDRSRNRWQGSIGFTIDLLPPQVTLSSLPPRIDGAQFALAFQSSDDDGAAGGVVHEVVKLQGCTLFDGATYGNGDGLLSDEVLVVNAEVLCALAAQCGLGRLDQPELRVDATDCGGNTGAATNRFAGSIDFQTGFCGPRRRRAPLSMAPRTLEAGPH